MTIIEIKALPNGGHRNQSWGNAPIPEGWAVVPKYMDVPNFPFGEVVAEEIDGVMTVTKWVAGVIPETEETASVTTDDILNTLLGVTKNE